MKTMPCSNTAALNAYMKKCDEESLIADFMESAEFESIIEDKLDDDPAYFTDFAESDTTLLVDTVCDQDTTIEVLKGCGTPEQKRLVADKMLQRMVDNFYYFMAEPIVEQWAIEALEDKADDADYENYIERQAAKDWE